MPNLTYDNLHVRVDFTTFEALMTRRRTFEARGDAITGFDVHPGWVSEIHGVRYGYHVTGWHKLGIWKHPSGTKRLIAMKRGGPVLRVRLGRDKVEGGFDELLISTPEAADIASMVQAKATA